MLPEERKKYVIDLLSVQPSVTVKELCISFNISEVSVRKLLLQMEEEDLLRRTWGGAVRISKATNEYSYEEKENLHKEEKMAIAKVAYDLMQDNETIYLDCGTTSFEIAKLIVQGTKKLIVCTNAFNILDILHSRTDISTIMIGGELRHTIYSCVGSLTIKMLEMMVFDRAFLTGDHFTLDKGFTVSLLNDAAVKYTAMSSAKRNYIIMDSSKYGEDSMAVITKPNSNNSITLITDWHISLEICDQFKKKGISLIRAEAI